MQRHAAEQSNLFSHRRSRGPPRVSFGVLSVGRAATHVVQMWLLPMAPPLPSAPCDQAHAAISETRRFVHGRDILSGRGNCCFRNNPAPERANPTSAAAPSRERGSGIFACHLAGKVLSTKTSASGTGPPDARRGPQAVLQRSTSRKAHMLESSDGKENLIKAVGHTSDKGGGGRKPRKSSWTHFRQRRRWSSSFAPSRQNVGGGRTSGKGLLDTLKTFLACCEMAGIKLVLG